MTRGNEWSGRAKKHGLVASTLAHAHALTLSLVLLAACTAVRLAPPPPVEVGVPVAAPTPTPEPESWILVRKTERTLSLYEGAELRKAYPVVLGRDPHWAKLHQGDHRTPEGEYHIVNKYFHPFWSRFMMLDYPTPANQEIYAWSRSHGLLPGRGRSEPGIGGAIGIHGTEDESLNRRGINWTEGCVSLFNHDVEELYDLVPVGTRVVVER
jgi:murein L,D-transpeptidase YafK